MTDWTTPGTFAVGEQPPASKLNDLSTAIGELQDAADVGAWQAITLPSGYAAWSSGGPKVRQVGGLAVCTGGIKINTGTLAAAATIGTLPAGLRPVLPSGQTFVTSPWLGAHASGGSTQVCMRAYPSGDLIVAGVSGSPTTVVLDGFVWSIV